jgi:putative membrane protein
MSSSETERESASRFNVKSSPDTHFSWIRTRMAAERTLMSYSRTAIALIGFGFTLYQFLAKLNATADIVPARYAAAPQFLAILLIGAGLLFLVTGLVDYLSFVHYMHIDTFAPVAGIGPRRWRTGTVVAVAALLVAGMFALLAVILQI